MYQKQILIQNEIGLHARPAGDFVRLASEYTSSITIGRLDGKRVNAKSILLILAQGFTKDTLVEIQAKGADEETAVNALVQYLESLA